MFNWFIYTSAYVVLIWSLVAIGLVIVTIIGSAYLIATRDILMHRIKLFGKYLRGRPHYFFVGVIILFGVTLPLATLIYAILIWDWIGLIIGFLSGWLLGCSGWLLHWIATETKIPDFDDPKQYKAVSRRRAGRRY